MENKVWLKVTSLVLVCTFTLATAQPAHAVGWKDYIQPVADIVKASSDAVAEVAVTYIEEKTKKDIVQGCLTQFLGSKESLILTSCAGAAVLIGAFACYKLSTRLNSVKVGVYEVEVKFKNGTKKKDRVEVLDPNEVGPGNVTTNRDSPQCPR